MSDIQIPDGYLLVNGELYKGTGAKAKKIVNAVPEVVSLKTQFFHGTNEKVRYVEVRFHVRGIREDTSYWYKHKDINGRGFVNNLPDSVIIEPGCYQKVEEVFRWCIKTGMQEATEEKIYPYGWTSGTFHWGDEIRMIPEVDKYAIATEAADLIMAGSVPLDAAFLAAIHGPLEGMLWDAGVRHDFTTDISGESGIGKTDLTRLLINNITGKAVSLSSDRKVLIEMTQNSNDLTLVLDDYNKTESGRTKERVLQTLTEIIQEQSDSFLFLTREGGYRERKPVHIVVTREEVLKNISTINRTYWVAMNEMLPLDLHNKVVVFSGEKMLFFIQSLIGFVGSDYDGILAKISADYKSFLELARKKYKYTRIADTIAVQRVLKEILVIFFKDMRLEEDIVQRVDSSLWEGIQSVGCDMCNRIDNIKKKAEHKKVLPVLAYIVHSIGNGYEMAANEKEYWGKVRKGLIETIGFCANNGYLSFSMEPMIKLIKSLMSHDEEDVTAALLSKELNAYNLAHKDNEKKLCSYWRTDRRMYHVEVRSLLELCYDDWNLDFRLKSLIEDYFTVN